ncbi:hypothetical protein MKW94_006764, partial [Papaver nudicaule]|nr:hypothetical protein [Papaver nudicaule]
LNLLLFTLSDFNEFEERLIGIHKEQIEKWQEEIKELRSLDVMNEDANTRLQMTRSLFQNVQIRYSLIR